MIPKFLNLIKKFPILTSLFSILIVLVLILAEHRYWLYSGIYTDLYNKIGSSGDAYYNLAIYLQNNTNILQGKLYSMNGDHFTWWSNIIAITGHGWAPSIIFGIFKWLTRSSIAAFNLLFFSNLILTQLGIFLLTRYWTKNPWIATISALFVPLSQGWNTFYMSHIHASFYWWLPFYILSVEKITNQKLNYKQSSFWLYLILASYALYWYIFADWHSFVFGSVFLIPYFIYKCSAIYQYFKAAKGSFFAICTSFTAIFISAIPFVIQVLDGSKIFNATRDLGSVNGTNFNTERFLGLKYILMPIISGITSRFPNLTITPKLNHIYESLSKTDSMYPDLLSIIAFWILLILITPWTIQLILKRGKFYPRLYLLACIILISFFIILGPYIKFGGSTLLTSYLPHQLIHTIFYPLQAIRAVWRGAFVGYLAVLILCSLLINAIWNRVNIQSSNPINRLSKTIAIVAILILTPIFMLIQNNGFTIINALDSFKTDTQLNSLLDKITTKKQSYDFYIWRKATPQDQAPVDYYHYTISERNNQAGYQQINWVIGGTAGAYSIEFSQMDVTHSRKMNLPQTIDILNKKQVNLILQENDSNPDNQQYSAESTKLLSEHWNKVGDSANYTLWQKKQQEPITTSPKLQYSINLSSMQSSESAKNYSINIKNPDNATWVNSQAVKPVNFRIVTYKGVSTYKTISKSFGEPAFLTPNNGLSFQWNNKERIFDIGVNNLKLFRNDIEVFSQDIKTLDKNDYAEILRNAQFQSLDLDKSDNTQLIGDYGLIVTPVNIRAKVISGVLTTNKNSGRPLIAQYRFRPINSQGDFSDYGMPSYIGQPSCGTEENYFVGDKIDLWCIQHAPQMKIDGYEFRINLQYQKNK